MPLFGGFTKKIMRNRAKAEGLQKPRNLSSKTVAYVEYPVMVLLFFLYSVVEKHKIRRASAAILFTRARPQ